MAAGRGARHPLAEHRLLVSVRSVAPNLGPGAREPLACVAVRVWEPSPPAGAKALEWILLTDLEVTNFDQACEVAQMYATRWLEDTFHPHYAHCHTFENAA